jgi:hypothetical protein
MFMMNKQMDSLIQPSIKMMDEMEMWQDDDGSNYEMREVAMVILVIIKASILVGSFCDPVVSRL